VPPGDYVVLTVRDTGTGMSSAVRRHIFEPFFTTKELGSGTGLGLAMVYGIVTQSGGFLQVDSEEGRGTAISVLLPRTGPPEAPGDAPPAEASAPPARGGATVLLVEDEASVRGAVRQQLVRRGYRVLAARHGVEALALAAGHDGPIDLLLTDVVMPQMGGPELARRMRQLRPETRVLYMSGYAADRASPLRGGAAPSLDAPCLEKPFPVDALDVAVRDTLAAARG
jgi:CheY-like chemotaxis protein